MTEQTDALDALNAALRHEICKNMFVISEDALEKVRKDLIEHAAIKDKHDQMVKDFNFIKHKVSGGRCKVCGGAFFKGERCRHCGEGSPHTGTPEQRALPMFSGDPLVPDTSCLSNPPQSDNQTVLTGEDDSQMDALEADNARLRDALEGIHVTFSMPAAYGNPTEEMRTEWFKRQALRFERIAQQALKGQSNDTE